MIQYNISINYHDETTTKHGPIKVGKYTHLSPFTHTEDPVGVISVLPDTVQLDWVPPLFSQILLYTGENRLDIVFSSGI